ncbi:hypothetical protein BZG36_02968 [Bifiguratus adelaidae]|uniref:Roadblock/LAMTOR2 domain-containing protein n=1 Tax=Bifiguratus adelaidae TaxID=1938954 RepID=A0A261Y0V6_9FUNG|nr:hypothetical protein BZG36_02968 [Bifiguratus adelaidae]
MLKPKVISQVLAQVTTGTVTAAILMNSSGSLLAFSAATDEEATTYAAIAANIWTGYSRAGDTVAEKAITTNNAYNKHDLVGKGQLNTIIVDCENGTLLITPISHMLLCLVGNPESNLGILIAKLQALRRHLSDPLEKVSEYSF